MNKSIQDKTTTNKLQEVSLKNVVKSEQVRIEKSSKVGAFRSQKSLGKKTFSCKHCSKLFSRQRHLKTHISVVHEGLKNFKCKYCEHAYGQSGDLNRHIERAHKNKLYLV